ncbi:hypothetical protein EKO27_g2736 [Xylaria grammica]|uniref:Uncharacterized protein n=1 Tax=Xylaria grammica TaxID=363999 RepID=A0A439DD44_9PEZI|nr:hypothetical protein EKO27_g2736 [Xylaria grammica]
MPSRITPVPEPSLTSECSESNVPPPAVPYPITHNINTPDTPNLNWRPLWLRRVTLIGFIAVFISLIIAIESLLDASNRNHGLKTGTSSEHYLWTYGPTAFLTGVSALWARTEFQSKLVAPWIRLSRNPSPASRSLLLDYISQLPPVAIFCSLRNKDFTVSITITVSIILKVLIIISTSLISLSLTPIDRQFPMVLRDSFVDSNAKLPRTGNLAYYLLQSIESHDLSLPDGISRDYAFQSVHTNLPDATETRVIVDGLTNSLNCNPVELRSAGAPLRGMDDFNPYNLSTTSPGCDVNLDDIFGPWVSEDFSSTQGHAQPAIFGRFTQVQCDGIDGDAGDRVFVIFGNLTSRLDYSRLVPDYDGNLRPFSVPVLDKSAQVLCIPDYTIHRVEVTRNGTQILTIKPQEGASNRSLDSVTAWDLLKAQYIATSPSDKTFHAVSETPPPDHLFLDDYLAVGFLSQLGAGTPTSHLFNPHVLQQTITAYYRLIGSIVAKQSLMHTASANTIGSATVNEYRLKMNPRIAHGMVILISICLILVGLVFFIVPMKCLLPQQPSTVLGLALIFSYSPQLLAQLRNAGACSNEYLAHYLRTSKFESRLSLQLTSGQTQFTIVDTEAGNGESAHVFPQVDSKPYHPLVLRTACRSAVCLTLVSLIIILETLLYKSNAENGLGNIEGETYIHYSWSVIPALTVGAVAMALSAIDFETRSLAPYAMLARNVMSDKFAQLEFLDSVIPKVMWKEARLKSLWLLATTTAFLVASLFATFSASVFQELSFSTKTSIAIQANQSFSLTSYPLEGYIERSSLIFASNYSFPRFTYKNLAFPQFVPITTLGYGSHRINKSTISTAAVIPALRGQMNCRLYDSARIQTKVKFSGTSETSEPYYLLSVIIDAENCQSDMGLYNSPYLLNAEFANNSTYFGKAIDSVTDGGESTICSDLVYIWGRVVHSPKFGIQHIAAAGCNESFEAVDVDVTFIGTALDFDSQNPPQPLESTVRNTTYAVPNQMEVDFMYGSTLVQVDVSPALLDPFFSVVVTSAWAIPISALGNSSTITNVTEAIKLHRGIYTAQLLAKTLGPANETNVMISKPHTGPVGPGNNDADLIRNATVTSAQDRRRVIQDAASTHILVALLATTLVLLIIGWVAGPPTNVLPRRPTSIASVMALVAGGNLVDQLPADAHLRSPQEIVAALGSAEAGLWMGWGTLPDEEGRLYGGENEGGVSQFGIFVVKREDMKLIRKSDLQGPWKRLRNMVTRTYVQNA